MKLSDFILMDGDQKKKALLHEGVLVGKRSNAGSMVFLFQFPHFYAESYFNVGTKGVEEFRVFTDPAALQPYLEAMPLPGLLP